MEAIFPDLKHKVAVVTGGGRGIGYELCQALRRQGSRVVAVDLEMWDGETGGVAHGLARVDGDDDFRFARGDVRDGDALDEIAAATKDTFGSVDILMNCAGICRSLPAETMPHQDWKDVVEVNFTGLFFACQAFGRIMLESRHGAIVNISSMSGHISNYPQPQSAYNASKAGVSHLTKCLAGEWADRGVRVNAVSPGYITTAMTITGLSNPAWGSKWTERIPAGRLGEPAEVVSTMLFLASDASSYCTGSDLAVDGGYTVW